VQLVHKFFSTAGNQQSSHWRRYVVLF